VHVARASNTAGEVGLRDLVEKALIGGYYSVSPLTLSK
jgi:hypothetical protein